MGVRMVLYILAFVIMVGVVFMIERRDTQAGKVAGEQVRLMRAELSGAVQKLDKLDGLVERVAMLETMVQTNEQKSTEMYRVSESKWREVEMIAHSAKMDAMRRPQKVEFVVPPIRIVTGPVRKKVHVPVRTDVDKPNGVDKTVIKDIKKKLKDLSQ